MTRLQIKETTIKRLFALSGNLCAFPSCNQSMVENSMVIGQICHIQAAEPGGERYNPNQTDEERRSFENLILLCPTHHKITNDVTAYPPEALQDMKAKHEANFQSKPFTISDELLAKIFNYDKREAIFDAVTNLIRTVMVRNSVSLQEILQFGRDIDKADLFFDQDITSYLEEIRLKATELFGRSQQLQNANLPPGSQRTELVENICSLVMWFAEQNKESRAKFYKYLRLT